MLPSDEPPGTPAGKVIAGDEHPTNAAALPTVELVSIGAIGALLLVAGVLGE